MTKRALTVDDVISLLNHSSLPTLISEGKDDVVVMRRLESEFATGGLSVLPVGGRSKVLEIFQRRSEITSGIKVAFVADLDVWLYTGIPNAFQSPDLLFTDGYSIENDMFRDGQLTSLMTGAEKVLFNVEIEKFANWYGLAVSRHLNDPSVSITKHPDHILADSTSYDQFCQLESGETLPAALIQQFTSGYDKYVRGKSLLGVLLRQLAAKKRRPSHNPIALLEFGAAKNGPLFQRISNWATNYF